MTLVVFMPLCQPIGMPSAPVLPITAYAAQQTKPSMQQASASTQKPISSCSAISYFGLGITFKAAEGLARGEILLDCIDKATEDLKTYAVLRLQSLSDQQYMALASMIYPIQITSEHFIHSAREAIKATAKLYTPPDKTLEYIQSLHNNRTQIALRSYALTNLRDLIAKASNESNAQKINHLGIYADALIKYLQLLPVHDDLWENSQENQEQLTKLHNQAPYDPLIALAFAELAMQNNKPFEALKTVTIALDAFPTMAHAYYVRALINLSLNLPALASDDLNRALKIQPENALFWRAKGTAYSLSGKPISMCGALYKACSLGNCEGLVQARNLKMCLKP